MRPRPVFLIASCDHLRVDLAADTGCTDVNANLEIAETVLVPTSQLVKRTVVRCGTGAALAAVLHEMKEMARAEAAALIPSPPLLVSEQQPPIDAQRQRTGAPCSRCMADGRT